MVIVGSRAIHLPTGRECFVIYINLKEPKYKVRFPNMHATDVYETELEEIEPAEPLIASEVETAEDLRGTDGVIVNKNIKKIREELK